MFKVVKVFHNYFIEKVSDGSAVAMCTNLGNAVMIRAALNRSDKLPTTRHKRAKVGAKPHQLSNSPLRRQFKDLCAY